MEAVYVSAAVPGGQQMSVGHNGQNFTVTVPPGVQVGQTFGVQLPAQAPAAPPVVLGTPVPVNGSKPAMYYQSAAAAAPPPQPPQPPQPPAQVPGMETIVVGATAQPGQQQTVNYKGQSFVVTVPAGVPYGGQFAVPLPVQAQPTVVHHHHHDPYYHRHRVGLTGGESLALGFVAGALLF